MADTCYPNTQKAEVGALLRVGAQPELYSSRLDCDTEQNQLVPKNQRKAANSEKPHIYKRNQANNRFPKVKTPGGSFVSSGDEPQLEENLPFSRNRNRKNIPTECVGPSLP